MKKTVTNVLASTMIFGDDYDTAKRALEFLREDKGMSDIQYEKFCLRYEGKDITTVINYLKRYSGLKITPYVSDYIKKEIYDVAQQVRQRQRARRAEEIYLPPEASDEKK